MLEVENLAVLRGERPVFKGVSFRVTACGALVVGGANGAGKSSLLRVLAGLGRAEAGAVRWAGGIAYVGHLDAVKPGLTVAENLAFHGIAGLEALGLADLADMPARFLSAGQKRRLALARLVGSSALLWVLDEPTVGLDAASVDRFGAIVAAHRARGGIVVAATHVALPLPGAAEIFLG